MRRYRTISLVAALTMTFCWMFQTTTVVGKLEHRIIMLEGQSVAQQGVVEGMYYDRILEDAPK